MRASQTELFEFHRRPANLASVMPPTTRVMHLSADEVAEVGGVLELRVREMGIVPMRWKCRWQRVESPSLLVDEMLEGPFETFEHSHRFEFVSENQTRLVDEVLYAWGRGWFGWIVSRAAVHLYLRLMFAWRHARMRELFSEGRTQDSSP